MSTTTALPTAEQIAAIVAAEPEVVRKDRYIEFRWPLGDKQPDRIGDLVTPTAVLIVHSHHPRPAVYTANVNKVLVSRTSFQMAPFSAARIGDAVPTGRFSAKKLAEVADQKLAELRQIVAAGVIPEKLAKAFEPTADLLS